jgi:magnesium-transporting ATPase (P-type)
MSLYEIYTHLNLYLPIFMACSLQFLFILAPINLLNWEDDLFNVFVYTGIHALLTTLIFTALPFFVTGFLPSNLTIFFSMGISMSLTFLRAVRSIPLERSRPTIKTRDPLPIFIRLEDFDSEERRATISEIGFDNIYDQIRYQKIKEKLQMKIERDPF